MLTTQPEIATVGDRFREMLKKIVHYELAPFFSQKYKKLGHLEEEWATYTFKKV